MTAKAKRDEYRNLSMEERLRMKKNGFASAPINKYCDSEKDSNDEEQKDTSSDDDNGDKLATLKRTNKNRPREMTSKRPVGRFREVLQLKKRKTRDPRFDAASGKLNEDLFKKSYAFLDEYKVHQIAQEEKLPARWKKPPHRIEIS
jgi:ribosomal RNA-processing protein 36